MSELCNNQQLSRQSVITQTLKSLFQNFIDHLQEQSAEIQCLENDLVSVKDKIFYKTQLQSEIKQTIRLLKELKQAQNYFNNLKSENEQILDDIQDKLQKLKQIVIHIYSGDKKMKKFQKKNQDSPNRDQNLSPKQYFMLKKNSTNLKKLLHDEIEYLTHEDSQYQNHECLISDLDMINNQSQLPFQEILNYITDQIIYLKIFNDQRNSFKQKYKAIFRHYMEKQNLVLEFLNEQQREEENEQYEKLIQIYEEEKEKKLQELRQKIRFKDIHLDLQMYQNDSISQTKLENITRIIKINEEIKANVLQNEFDKEIEKLESIKLQYNQGFCNNLIKIIPKKKAQSQIRKRPHTMKQIKQKIFQQEQQLQYEQYVPTNQNNQTNFSNEFELKNLNQTNPGFNLKNKKYSNFLPKFVKQNQTASDYSSNNKLQNIFYFFQQKEEDDQKQTNLITEENNIKIFNQNSYISDQEQQKAELKKLRISENIKKSYYENMFYEKNKSIHNNIMYPQQQRDQQQQNSDTSIIQIPTRKISHSTGHHDINILDQYMYLQKFGDKKNLKKYNQIQSNQNIRSSSLNNNQDKTDIRSPSIGQMNINKQDQIYKIHMKINKLNKFNNLYRGGNKANQNQINSNNQDKIDMIETYGNLYKRRSTSNKRLLTAVNGPYWNNIV